MKDEPEFDPGTIETLAWSSLLRQDTSEDHMASNHASNDQGALAIRSNHIRARFLHPLWWLASVRLGYGLITLLIVSLIIFFAVDLQPGDLAQILLGQEASPETVAALRHELHLDLPSYQRYMRWLWNMLHGDLGQSLATQRRIGPLIAERFSNTVFLAGMAATIAIPLSITLGITASLKRNSLIDRLISVGSVAAVSMPEFFLAYVVILVFALQLRLFPSLPRIESSTGVLERIYQCALPALSLASGMIAQMTRMSRAAILSVLSNSYIEMAYLKGIGTVRIVLRHALPNALGPIITVVLLNLAYVMVGAVVVETVFSYPGLGQLLVDSVFTRDLPVVQAVSLIFACCYVVLNIAADILSTFSNPRLLHPR